MKNPYVPQPATIKEVKKETSDVVTLKFSLDSGNLNYKPGQFLEVSVFGVGEAPISIASTPNQKEMELSVKKVGSVTSELHKLSVGDKIWIRGPYGNGFPIEKLRGKDVIFVGGGIGLPPLRSLINYMLNNRKDFGKLYILYGARTPVDLVFRDELEVWRTGKNVEVHLTVDKAVEGWTGHVGVVPNLLKKIKPDIKKTYAVICGPEIMIKFTVKALLEMGFPENQIIFTLERMMKCGIGKCGRCNIGSKYVCIDGPVFSYDEIKKEQEFRL